MISYEVGYKTGSGNLMSLIVHGALLQREGIVLIDDVLDLCNHEGGCKGYNGGCPPHAPAFGRLKPSVDHVMIIAVEFDMAAAITYSGWWKGVSAPGLYILVYADRLTMNYTQRLLKHFEALGFYTLGVSNCPGCRPKDCTVITGGKCSKPKKRRFSVEAVGVSCDHLHWQLFGEALPWWFRTKEHMPCKMVRYACVFTDKSSDTMYDLLQEAVVGDKSYSDELLDMGEDYDVEQLYIPDGCYDRGHRYLAYVIPVERMRKWKRRSV